MKDHELDPLLKAADSPPSAPPGFQRDVWLRIESAERAGWMPACSRILERGFGWIAKPVAAVATCSAMLVVGIWLGSIAPPRNAGDKLSYIESVSPFTRSQP